MNYFLFLKIFFLGYIFGYSECGNHRDSRRNERSRETTGKAEMKNSETSKKKPALPWLSASDRRNIYGNRYLLPLYSANVNSLLEHWHLMYPTEPLKINLEGYFSENIQIIKAPPKGDIRFLTNVEDEWEMCTAISRNGWLLPKHPVVQSYNAERLLININNVENGKNIPAIQCDFIFRDNNKIVTVYATNGPQTYTYFVAEAKDRKQNLVTLKSFFHQFRDVKKPTSKETKYLPGLERLMNIRINRVELTDVSFEIRIVDELEQNSKDVLADMVKKYQMKLSESPNYRYFPEAEEENFDIINSHRNRFVLAKVEGVIIGMAMFEVESKRSRRDNWKPVITYYIEPEFQCLQNNIFKNMIDITTKIATMENDEGRNWKLLVVLSPEDGAKHDLKDMKFELYQNFGDRNGFPVRHVYSWDVKPEPRKHEARSSGSSQGPRTGSPPSRNSNQPSIRRH